jgi:hypothetical protein
VPNYTSLEILDNKENINNEPLEGKILVMMRCPTAWIIQCQFMHRTTLASRRSCMIKKWYKIMHFITTMSMKISIQQTQRCNITTMRQWQDIFFQRISTIKNSHDFPLQFLNLFHVFKRRLEQNSKWG